jgi:hypothetical protein
MNAITTSQEYRALMMFDRLPAGCISFMCTDDYSAPHIRPGEFVVVDTSDRQPRHLELYVIQWENGRRVLCQACDTGRKIIEQPAENAWSIGSLRAIRGRAAIEEYLDQESAKAHATGTIPTLRGLGWGDGWLTASGLSRKLVGCVIGLYSPREEGPLKIVGGGV